MADSRYLIPMDRFDNEEFIENRLQSVPEEHVGHVRTTLKYLYLTNGPINLPRSRLKTSEQYLDEPELILVRWLFTRTNGSSRKEYGSKSLTAARRQRYRCEHCGHADVRVLNLDHVTGRKAASEFACLCANCHALKSRKHDWTGMARDDLL